MSNEVMYDVVIIGVGLGGFNVVLYVLRSGLKILIIEKEVLGGKINLIFEVENWLGFKKISGFEFLDILYFYVMVFGVKFKSVEVVLIKYVNFLL